MAFNNTTLALDLSLSSPGFAVLANTSEGAPIILDKSYVTTSAKQSHGYRINEIRVEMDRLIDEYDPQHIVRERGFSRFPAVTQTLFKVVGMTDLVAHNHGLEPVSEIAVTSVKKLVTGNGKASKEDVAEAVFKRLRIDNTDEFYTPRGKLIDDLTDACAVGLAYYIAEELIEE